SIIYLHSPGQFEPTVGNFLGDLTDELTCYGTGSFITEFVCGCPKNYAYKVFNPDSGVCTQCVPKRNQRKRLRKMTGISCVLERGYGISGHVHRNQMTAAQGMVTLVIFLFV
ncbi:hypothetical protein CBL_20826, partial [Carabus blaptoides fortunei]